MTTPRLTVIHHVKIPVTDLARSIDWYQRVFGFRISCDNETAAEGCKGFNPDGLEHHLHTGARYGIDQSHAPATTARQAETATP